MKIRMGLVTRKRMNKQVTRLASALVVLALMLASGERSRLAAQGSGAESGSTSGSVARSGSVRSSITGSGTTLMSALGSAFVTTSIPGSSKRGSATAFAPDDSDSGWGSSSNEADFILRASPERIAVLAARYGLRVIRPVDEHGHNVYLVRGRIAGASASSRRLTRRGKLQNGPRDDDARSSSLINLVRAD